MIDVLLKKDIDYVLDYLWRDEEKHYQECENYPKDHIFRVLKRLAQSTGYKYESKFELKLV